MYMFDLLNFALSIAPALVGGAVRYFNDISRYGKEFSFKMFFVQTLMAGFIGFVTIAILGDVTYFNERETLKGAVVGIASYLSPNILEIIEKRIPKILDDKIKK